MTRISDHTVYNNVLANLNDLMARQTKLHEQLSSGKRVEKPSDDPFAFVKSLGLKTEQSSGAQYSKNIEDSNAWIQMTSEALATATKALQRVSELAVEGSDGTKTLSDLKPIAGEVEQLLQHLVDVANTKYLGRSLFAGNQTLQSAFTITSYDANGNVNAVTYNGDSGIRSVEIGKGRMIPLNSLGSNELGGAPRGVFRSALVGVDVFQTLMDLRDDLLAGDINTVMNTDIGAVQTCLSNVLSFQTEIGAKQSRLDMSASELDDRETDLVKLISENEDLDYAEATMRFSEVQSTYEAALATAARIMDTTLLDFLR